MTDDRLDLLLAALLDGSLTPPERDELLDAAADRPEYARRMIELLSLEPLLSDWTLTASPAASAEEPR